MDDPHAEVEIKPQLKPRGNAAKEEDPKSPTSRTSCRLNPHDQLHRLCLWNTYKAIESSHKRKHNSSDSCRHCGQEHTGVGTN